MSSLPLPIAAFAAGLISFLTPSVLLLVPAYISLISGVGLDEVKQQQRGRLFRSVMLSSILFMVGFSAVFIALGTCCKTSNITQIEKLNRSTKPAERSVMSH